MRRKTPTINGEPTTMGGLRHFVINRDGVCLGYVHDPTHQCANQWGDRHGPYDLDEMTLEHVPGVHGPTDVRRDDEAHCVTLCSRLNVGAPSHALREFLRQRLRDRYPECTKGD